jgi:hypothetical protein
MRFEGRWLKSDEVRKRPEVAKRFVRDRNERYRDGELPARVAGSSSCWEAAMKCCSICGKDYVGFGNNAAPLNDGRCCDDCNARFVVPLRLKMARKPKEPE